MKAADAGGSKPQEAAQDAASSVKAAVPDEPKQAAQDAVSAAKDSLPEPPKDIPNPFQNLFSGKASHRKQCLRQFCDFSRANSAIQLSLVALSSRSSRQCRYQSSDNVWTLSIGCTDCMR